MYYQVDSACAEYLAQTEPDACQNYRDCEPVASISDFYYIGGYYGSMSEELILRELRANGPLLYDFQANSLQF